MGKNQLGGNTEERGKGLVLILVKFCNVWTPYSVHSMVQYARIFLRVTLYFSELPHWREKIGAVSKFSAHIIC